VRDAARLPIVAHPSNVSSIFPIGVWLGFIVLDGATYMLLALTLVVVLPLVHANAIKSAALVPTTMVAMAVFAYKGNIDWTIGAVMAVGSIGGAGRAPCDLARGAQVVLRLLVIVICAELVHLTTHYVFATV
jgi:uncharacterized membrane protein YfcA